MPACASSTARPRLRWPRPGRFVSVSASAGNAAELELEQLLQLRDRLLGIAVKERGHPDRLGALAVLAQIVDEHRLGGLDLEPLAGEQVDLRLRLMQADRARDHRHVEDV